METLETGTLFIRSKKLEETSEHVSRLSIRCILNGEQRYRVGRNEHLVTPKNYLVVNQGQLYQTSFKSAEEQEMILVAFKPGYAEALLYSLSATEDQLLDDPHKPATDAVRFFEQTYEYDPVIAGLFSRLRMLMDAPLSMKQTLDLDQIYGALLTRLIRVHKGLYTDINRLGQVRLSTREELYRRLHIARDFMDANAGQNQGLHDAATAACLSVHHFKRAFRELFGITPHRYLVNKRLEKACHLLEHTGMKVEEVCTASGFGNNSAFIRLFHQHTGTTPLAWRNRGG